MVPAVPNIALSLGVATCILFFAIITLKQKFLILMAFEESLNCLDRFQIQAIQYEGEMYVFLRVEQR